MKAALKSRPSPEEAVRIAAAAAPSLPPARLGRDKALPFNTRLGASTSAAVEARARAEGAPVKQVICHALAASGVAPADLEDGTPRRRSI